ncbi:hypothetical protein Tsubulata_000143 [Turnera subulata]|uniref:Uncharacterized protein n=1 Tax=Turnera subulata TaxID=218843 RepID=A0A9Q0FKR8_9ROSI|nr:hypothetical protein Tsubulata_000143 [Turnera subulata]
MARSSNKKETNTRGPKANQRGGGGGGSGFGDPVPRHKLRVPGPWTLPVRIPSHGLNLTSRGQKCFSFLILLKPHPPNSSTTATTRKTSTGLLFFFTLTLPPPLKKEDNPALKFPLLQHRHRRSWLPKPDSSLHQLTFVWLFGLKMLVDEGSVLYWMTNWFMSLLLKMINEIGGSIAWDAHSTMSDDTDDEELGRAHPEDDDDDEEDNE